MIIKDCDFCSGAGTVAGGLCKQCEGTGCWVFYEDDAPTEEVMPFETRTVHSIDWPELEKFLKSKGYDKEYAATFRQLWEEFLCSEESEGYVKEFDLSEEENYGWENTLFVLRYLVETYGWPSGIWQIDYSW